METISEHENLSRLRWQCRRGMLELDEFLNAFLDRCYADLTDPQRQTFNRVLALPDQQLLDYLLAQSKPADRDMADVIEQIRHSART